AVARFRPDVWSVELGFNDLAFGVDSPQDLVADLGVFVAEARAANPDVMFLVANVTQRTPLPLVPLLPVVIADYNARLAAAVAELNAPDSSVWLVDIDAATDPATDTYDGVHPNGLGEHKIARAFADALSSGPGIGAPLDQAPTASAADH
nr:GDSL-type esterase/lipase family protein [Micromonospora sp. DSM 115978]